MTDATTDRRQEKRNRPFAGFEPLSANFIYCPNQFFDVCLRSESRGVVRIVGYLLKRTLGWLDEEGSPVEQDISASYAQLIVEAGVSRGALAKALNDAIDGGYITRLRPGSKKSTGQPATTACFGLRWDQGDLYQKDANHFVGFFAGEGHRTPVPKSFFDVVVPRENLAVLKVVGAVLRHTVGYQNQFGGRLRVAPLSYSFIQRYTNLTDRSTVSAALRHAIASGYIVRTQEGTVGPAAADRRPALYAIKWLDHAKKPTIGSKFRPGSVQKPDQLVRSKIRPAHQFKNQTSSGSETRPADRFNDPTKEIQNPKETQQQRPQVDSTSVAAAFDDDSFALLHSAGFDAAIARTLATGRSVVSIKQQIAWLEARNPRENRLGLLRRAIEEDWSDPRPKMQPTPKPKTRDDSAASAFSEEAEKAARYANSLADRRTALLAAWRSTPISERKAIFGKAIVAETSAVKRNSLTRRMDYDDPPSGVLEFFAMSAGIEVGERGVVSIS